MNPDEIKELIEKAKTTVRVEFENQLAEAEENLKIEIARVDTKALDISPTDLPAHTHQVDKIKFRDLQGGMEVISSTPTFVAEEGKMLTYTIGSTSYLAVKVGVTWKKTTLTNV